MEISKTLEELKKLQEELRDVISPDVMIPKIGEDKLTIGLSEEIIDLVNPDLEANLVAHTVKARQRLTDRLGYVIPRVKFQDDETIQANEYCIKIRGIPAFRGQVFTGCLMYYKDELNLGKLPSYAIADVDLYTDKKVVWLPVEKTKDFWAKGYSASEVIAQNLEYTCIKYIEELFDYTDVNCYLEIVGLQNAYLIENIIPDFLSVAEVKYILTSLIKEQISIKDILYVFEKINDFADEETKDDLLDKIRISLKRQISAGVANEMGVIQGFALSEKNVQYLENAIAASEEEETEADEDIIRIAIEEDKVLEMAAELKKKAKKHNFDSRHLVIVAPYLVRHILYLLLSQFIPNIKVIAKEEISKEYSLEILDDV